LSIVERSRNSKQLTERHELLFANGKALNPWSKGEGGGAQLFLKGVRSDWNFEQSRVELEFQFHTRLFEKNRFHGTRAEISRYLMVRAEDSSARGQESTPQCLQLEEPNLERGMFLPPPRRGGRDMNIKECLHLGFGPLSLEFNHDAI